MSRKKLCTVVAGWLAATSVGVAQSRQATSNKALSPYYPTASTVDRRGSEEASDMPPEMPNMPVPRASTPARGMYMMQSQPGGPPVPATVSPAAPAAPAPGAAGGCGPNGCGPNGNCGPVGNWYNGGPGNCANGNCGPVTWNNGPMPDSDQRGPLGADERLWASVEFLEWWTKGMNSPALITGSPTGTPLTAAGILGGTGTTVLAGKDKFNSDNAPGFRLRTGFWVDSASTFGFEGSYFFLGRRSDDHTVFATSLAPIIARPFFDAAPLALLTGSPTPSSLALTYPGLVSGIATTSATNEFYGADVNFRKNCDCSDNHRIDFLAGYRYARLKDTLLITDNVTAIPLGGATIPFGTQTITLPFGTGIFHSDRFETRNDFNGGQVGFAGEWRRGRWFLGGRTLVAIGNVHKEAVITGSTLSAIPGVGAGQTNAGVLVQPTNYGSYRSNDFAVLPEGSVTVGVHVTDSFRIFAGYTFMYWSNVWRAGDQIDLTINTTQVGAGPLIGAPRPQFPSKDTDFWAQGVSAGLELRY
jgi:hypothetical protein